MQSVLMAAARAVALDPPYDSVFEPLIDDLVDALAGGDPAGLLTTVEGQARLLKDIHDWEDYVRIAKLKPQG